MAKYRESATRVGGFRRDSGTNEGYTSSHEARVLQKFDEEKRRELREPVATVFSDFLHPSDRHVLQSLSDAHFNERGRLLPEFESSTAQSILELDGRRGLEPMAPKVLDKRIASVLHRVSMVSGPIIDGLESRPAVTTQLIHRRVAAQRELQKLLRLESEIRRREVAYAAVVGSKSHYREAEWRKRTGTPEAVELKKQWDDIRWLSNIWLLNLPDKAKPFYNPEAKSPLDQAMLANMEGQVQDVYRFFQKPDHRPKEWPSLTEQWEEFLSEMHITDEELRLQPKEVQNILAEVSLAMHLNKQRGLLRG